MVFEQWIPHPRKKKLNRIFQKNEIHEIQKNPWDPKNRNCEKRPKIEKRVQKFLKSNPKNAFYN